MRESPREQWFTDLAQARRLRPPRLGFLNKTLRRLAAFFAAALLRESIARRAGLIQRTHPLARLLAALVFLLSVSVAASPAALLAHGLLVAIATGCARIRLREILGAGLVIAFVFSSLMALPATLNIVSGGSVVLPLLRLGHPREVGPYTLPAVVGVSREGVHTAASFLLRTLASTAAVLCLALSTRWTDLLASLRSLGLPPLFLQTAGMAMRYLHLFLRQGEEAHMAKKSRTCCRGPLASDQMWVGSRVAAAWERGLHLMTDVAEAMTARGFTGEARFPPGRPLRMTDWTFLALTAVLCLGAHLV